MSAIKYISYGDTSGYGLAGLAYLRGLVNLGHRLWWRPIFWGAGGLQYWARELGREQLEIVRAAEGDPTLRDIHAVLDATETACEYDTVIAHIVPEYLPGTFEPGKRNLAYCAWESDTIPAHWPEILNRYDAVLVPSAFNAETFRRGGVRVPVFVLPHIRRHAHDEVTPAARAKLRGLLQIPADNFVFYSVGAWMLRKDFPRLVQAYVEEFSQAEPVSLLIKTSTRSVHHELPQERGKTPQQMVQEAADQANAECRRQGAHITVLSADGLSGAWIDCIHQVGDAFVSLSRAEGWGMGGFEAALLGRPVLMTGWGGALDYLGADNPLNLAFSLEPIDWPGTSYAPDHRWAVADIADVRRKLRCVFDARGEPLDSVTQLSERLCNEFSESRVMRTFAAILRAEGGAAVAASP
jgi:glycosyltransferase involved in cell wall biosynthesis